MAENVPSLLKERISRRQFLFGGRRGGSDAGSLGVVLGGAGIGLAVTALGIASGSGSGAGSVSDLPNGTLLLDKSIETNQLVFFSITEQFYDLVTDTVFKAGEELLVTAEFGFEGDTNAAAQWLARLLVEGVEIKSGGLSLVPATGAGDTWAFQPQGTLSARRVLATGGTKTFRVGVTTSGIGNGDVVIYNRRIYRIKNASS